jgi:thioredoxin reductase (NADPH)
MDLMENMKKQAIDFGAQIDDLRQIKEISLSGEEKLIKTDGSEYHAKSVIIATGAEPRKLPVEGEREFRGRGVHYCAACDGAMYQDANVMVIGGGISAVEEAEFLSRYAKTVTIVNRSDHFKAAEASIDKALKNPSVSVIWDTIIKEIKGDSFLRSVVLENVKTGEKKETPIDGLFVYIGTQPNTAIFRGQVKLSDNGYILTDENMASSIPGVFAAGDVRDKEIRQITTAVGDGTIAGMMSERYLNHR